MNYDTQTLQDAIDMEDDPQARAALRLALKNLETDEDKPCKKSS